MTAPDFRPDGTIAFTVDLDGAPDTLVILRTPRLGELRAFRARLEQLTMDQYEYAAKLSVQQQELIDAHGGNVAALPPEILRAYRQINVDNDDHRMTAAGEFLAGIIQQLAGAVCSVDAMPAWIADAGILARFLDHWQTVPTLPGSGTPG